ncbi:ribonuclease HI [Candidatus Ichthyocystis hellenicum]|uniref:ribonuclease HI n=1 Tax=Candidatus Ichthyocystis hellenicum TaxID=1561003 RepID=UPI000A99EC1E|nr:ribonuclease HI [Candidatus Ichthyocystis hellenicum]
MHIECVEIYTDGSCLGNPGVGGWAAIVVTKQKTTEYFGFAEQTTNNQMELSAAIEGLKKAIDYSPQKVLLFSDSQYMRLGITQWIHQWKKNGWRTSNRKDVKNKNLWEKLDVLNQNLTIEWNWVKAHNGNPLNERADYLARTAASSRMTKQE